MNNEVSVYHLMRWLDSDTNETLECRFELTNGDTIRFWYDGDLNGWYTKSTIMGRVCNQSNISHIPEHSDIVRYGFFVLSMFHNVAVTNDIKTDYSYHN